MHRHSRRILFWTFVILFFITAPAITVYALGYRFSPERGIFIFTGSITLKTNPSVADVSIDGKPSNADVSRINGSYHIGGLRPGEHFIEISAPDYTPWSKKVIVSSGLSTEYWNIMLTREDYEKTSYNVSGIQKTFPAPKSTVLAYLSQEDKAIKVGVLDIETNEAQEVFSLENASFPENDKENIEWSISSDRLAIPLQKDGQKDYSIVNAETKEGLSLKELTGASELYSVRWDSARDNTLFYVADHILYEMNIEDPSSKQLVAEDVQSYDISGDYIYTFQAPSGIVQQTRLGNPNSKVQITATAVPDMSDPNYSLIVYDDSRLALINYRNGNLFVYSKGEKENHFQQLSSDARGAQFSNDGKKLLYWSDWEIFAYFTRKWEAQPLRDEGALLNIGRFSQNISNVHWAQDYEHVTFSVGSEIKLIELDQRERIVRTLLTLPHPPLQVISNFFENKIFYVLPTDPNDSQTSLQSIDFPEETGLFGFGR